MAWLYIRLGSWNNGRQTESTEILMLIVLMSRGAQTQASLHTYFAMLFYEVMLRLSAVYFILFDRIRPIPTVL